MQYIIETDYKGKGVRYNASSEDGDVFHLRLESNNGTSNKDYVPEKLVIRKKGQIWVSDLEDYEELVDRLIASISQQQFSII